MKSTRRTPACHHLSVKVSRAWNCQTHRVLDLNVRVLLLRLLQSLDQLVQVFVSALVELAGRNVRGHSGVLVILRLLGRGFSLSGMIPRTRVLPWKARTDAEALPVLTAAARAMMQLAGVDARNGAAAARRRARVLSLATDFMVMECGGCNAWLMSGWSGLRVLQRRVWRNSCCPDGAS